MDRTPGQHRSRFTDFGLRTALFFPRAYAPIFRVGLTQILDAPPASAPSRLHNAFRLLEHAFDDFCQTEHIAA